MNERDSGRGGPRPARADQTSDGFRDAGRLGPFLKYVVEATLSSRPVKEALVGADVFGRAADYDPKTDPIVRVEARRLRSRLEDFYQKNPLEPVRIDLPKGGYVPSFSRIAKEAAAVAPAVTRRLAGPSIVIGLLLLICAGIGWLFWARSRAMNSPVPAVAVLPFRNVSADPANDYFSDGLTIELIDALTKVEQLRVVSWNSASRFRGKAGSLQELRDQLQAGSVVDGTVRKYGDRLRITAQLIDTNSGQTIWSDTYERQAKDIFQVQERKSPGRLVLLAESAAPGRSPADSRPSTHRFAGCLQRLFASPLLSQSVFDRRAAQEQRIREEGNRGRSQVSVRLCGACLQYRTARIFMTPCCAAEASGASQGPGGRKATSPSIHPLAKPTPHWDSCSNSGDRDWKAAQLELESCRPMVARIVRSPQWHGHRVSGSDGSVGGGRIRGSPGGRTRSVVVPGELHGRLHLVGSREASIRMSIDHYRNRRLAIYQGFAGQPLGLWNGAFRLGPGTRKRPARSSSRPAR